MIVIENPNPQDHLRTEWLLTNRLGGYAMGTVLGVNTRRYHGLLVAATNPPVGRIVALHSMIEQLVIPRDDGTEDIIDLSTQMFIGPDGEPMLHPRGWKRLKSFEYDPGSSVTWRWEIEGIIVSKRVLCGLAFSAFNATQTFLTVQGSVPPGTTLRLRPFLPFRDFHSLSSRAVETPTVREEPRGIVVSVAQVQFLLAIPSARWRSDPQWWDHFAMSEERSRGQVWSEDLWSPGVFENEISQSGVLQALTLTAMLPDWDLPDDDESVGNESANDEIDDGDLAINRAASAFVVQRGLEEPQMVSIIAGYPWFADWGRDAMISLPGLLLCTNRFDEAGEVLHTFARQMRNGLIPNRFDDQGGDAHYNSVDASLWFVYAVWQYVKSGQRSVASGQSELIDACRELINAYRDGTDFNIRMDGDGLMTAGDETTQLTWMDAKRDGVVFTPRHGKAVEVNALWCNALHCLADMTADERETRDLRELAARMSESFRAQFWWKEKMCLHDVVQSAAPDNKLRPNQILAASLPHSPLARDQQRAVIQCVQERFLTPFGLRTLDRNDPDYQPRYEGNLFERDRAYHNGSVWPWLIGPYCESLLRINDFNEESKQEVRAVIQPLLDELEKTTGPRCLGQIAEVYDGDPPHRPSGCTAQAWSVAEVLRILSLIEHDETTDAPP